MISLFDPLSPIYSELLLHRFLHRLFAPWRTVQFREFETAVTQNISDLEGQTWRSKFLRMLFLVKLASLTILRWIWWNFFFNFFKIMENFKKSTVTFVPQQLRFDNMNQWKADKNSYKMVYLVNLYNFIQGNPDFWPIYTGL